MCLLFSMDIIPGYLCLLIRDIKFNRLIDICRKIQNHDYFLNLEGVAPLPLPLINFLIFNQKLLLILI